MKILAINCKPDLSYFSKRGLNFDIDYKTETKVFPLKFLYKVKDINGSMVDTYTPDVGEYMEKEYSDSEYSILYFGWSPSLYGNEAKYTGGYAHPTPLSNGAMWTTVRQDTIPNNNYFLHETLHILPRLLYAKNVYPRDFMDIDIQGRPYYLNDQPENPDSNYSQTWNQVKIYLSLLNNHKIMKYKYFSEKEIVGLKPELVSMLDRARGYAGVPFKITSGFRTPKQNKKVGGVQDSSHETGLAVDILVRDSVSGGKILKGLSEALLYAELPFRFGFYADGHIHVDIDTTKPSPCYWLK